MYLKQLITTVAEGQQSTVVLTFPTHIFPNLVGIQISDPLVTSRLIKPAGNLMDAQGTYSNEGLITANPKQGM